MKIYFLLILVFIAFLLVSCSDGSSNIPEDKRCSVDSDCVKATCCHAAETVNIEFGLDCGKQMCTQECVPATLDCGQGEIKCVDGSCTILYKD